MTQAPHVPVLLAPLMARLPGLAGVWVDGTFGAGGYSRAFLDAGADLVIGVDQDPEVFDRAALWAGDYGDRLRLVRGNFGDLDALAAQTLDAELPCLDGVVLDIGVSSMQIDQAGRGFSFAKDGPLDMRMAQDGVSAADLVNGAGEGQLADILFQYGEERASRRIAKAIVMDRAKEPFTTTRQLASLLERLMPRPKKDQPHPATRSFQALRIAVNDELGALVRGLIAAERALRPGGVLAVVTFHSLEDRIVKRYFAAQSGQGGQGNRHQPARTQSAPGLSVLTRKAVTADAQELAANPRARSAKLRMATRTDAAATPVDLAGLGLPRLDRDALSAGGRT